MAAHLSQALCKPSRGSASGVVVGGLPFACAAVMTVLLCHQSGLGGHRSWGAQAHGYEAVRMKHLSGPFTRKKECLELTATDASHFGLR